MQSYASQPTPPNWYTPFNKGDLIPRMGASTNLPPTIFDNLSLIRFQYISWITSPTQPTLHHLYPHPSTIQQILPIT